MLSFTTSQIVPNSGRGWQLVTVSGRPDGGGAQLRALVPLDKENPEHKHGLRFQVQVTDQVRYLSNPFY